MGDATGLDHIAALEAEVERGADELKRLRLMFGNTCRDLGLDPSNGDADIAAAIEALRVKAAKLRQDRDEARARLAKVGEAVGYAGSRWDEWGTRAETVGEMLHDALSGSVGEGVR